MFLSSDHSGPLALKPNFLAAAERMCFPAAEVLSLLLEGVLPVAFPNKPPQKRTFLQVKNHVFGMLGSTVVSGKRVPNCLGNNVMFYFIS